MIITNKKKNEEINNEENIIQQQVIQKSVLIERYKENREKSIRYQKMENVFLISKVQK